jgi:type II secretory pathway component PulM
MMALPHRLPGAPRKCAGRTRDPQPRLRDVLLGTGAFLLAAAACLYFVAQLAS